MTSVEPTLGMSRTLCRAGQDNPSGPSGGWQTAVLPPVMILNEYHNTEDAKTDHETRGTSERVQCVLLTFSD